MKTAILGSRNLHVDIDIAKYIPAEATEIISAAGIGEIDLPAEIYADKKKMPKFIFRPKHSELSPLERNKIIMDISDMIIILWDGKSCDTKDMIDYALETGKLVKVYSDRT